MKAYTDIEQSKKLAEILPLESADMRYSPLGDNLHPWIWTDTFIEKDAVPCWSLAKLQTCKRFVKSFGELSQDNEKGTRANACTSRSERNFMENQKERR